MVMAATIQHHEEGDRAPSACRHASSRQPSGWDRTQVSRQKTMDTHSSINNYRDARNIIDGQRREREEEELHRRDDERERFGVQNDRSPCDNKRDR